MVSVLSFPFPSPLPPPPPLNNSTNIHVHYLTHWFSSNLFPFFLYSLPFPWQFFLLFGHYFDHLVCLPHTSLATFTPIASFTGFPALWSILLLLSTFIFPPPGKSFQYFGPFFQSIYSACCFNLFLQPIFWPLF